MDDKEQRCKREDLRVIINVPTFWGVNDDGSMDIYRDYGEGMANESDNFDSYHCGNCGEFFTQAEERDDAWQAALDHLKQQEAA